MNLLVTAGNTQVPIDQVRCLTNIFTGRTGAAIALEAYRRGHRVTLLTSHPEAVEAVAGEVNPSGERWLQLGYRTYDDLRGALQQQLGDRHFDAMIHSAAVSDYLAAGVFAPAPGTAFHREEHAWHASAPPGPAMIDRAAGKIRSDEPELWLRLLRAPKLIDMIRSEWDFRGKLVKFKLEVGVTEAQLREIAEKSRVHSGADFMVANTLEGASSWALLGPLATGYARIERRDLAGKLMDALEKPPPVE